MPFLDLYGDIVGRRLTDSEGAPLTLPTLVQSDDAVCRLRFLDRVDDEIREKQVNIRSLKASIGKVQAPPADGTFRLCFGGSQSNASGDLTPAMTADEFKNALATGATAAGLAHPGDRRGRRRGDRHRADRDRCGRRPRLLT